MSWVVINEMLGLAAVDHVFCQQLLAEPVAAAQAYGFELTQQEQDILHGITARDLQEFSQTALARLPPDSP